MDSDGNDGGGSISGHRAEEQSSSDAAPSDAPSDAPSNASSQSSTSTQWPSAPPSPNSSNGNVSRLQSILDRALLDPFSSHPETVAHLQSNTEVHCKQAAEKIYDADVLLVVTGAGFSADSGLATYIDVADIEAYRQKGWRYRDLCKPPSFGKLEGLIGKTAGGKEEGRSSGEGKSEGVGRGDVNGGGEPHGNAEGKSPHEEKEQIESSGNAGGKPPYESINSMESYEMQCKDGSDGEGSDGNNINHLEMGLGERRSSLPDEEDIEHPQYFYGFWGQCCNDYRRVRPHNGYDIIARWGRGKNFQKKDGDGDKASWINEKPTAGDASGERIESDAAREIRQITRMLEQGGGDGSNGSNGSSDSELFNFNEDDEIEPYYVSPTQRAGAFFVFTSNVDAHSFDVFASHEIRECHGNVELWQCHNFACGTNATVADGGSLDGFGDNDGQSDVEIEKPEQPKKWQRRLWRLPMDHRFAVDCNSMQAPYLKSSLESQAAGKESASTSSMAERPLSSPPDAKRRKSSLSEREESTPADGRGQSCHSAAFDSGTCNDANDTATALGGIMEDCLRNHLERKMDESEVCDNDGSGGARESSDSADAPAHVGDVHGKPRLFPLRHMNPPTTVAPNDESVDAEAQNHFLPIAPSENWPRCPRCQEAARPAVLMFNDLDWVYNLKQEQRWQRWCQSLLKLCKLRRGRVDGLGDGESSSTVSDTNMSEKGWEDVSEPSMEGKIEQTADTSTSPAMLPAVPEKQQSLKPRPPLKVAILEIGCGYNVPTCRVIAERIVGELTLRGGDASLIRINPSHPEPDDHSVEDYVISVMEKGLAALKIIDKHYQQLVADSSQNGK